jgi:ectoine hydroxylase-related dioxygenase (phytanoyl-CoA dioxygenase family)
MPGDRDFEQLARTYALDGVVWVRKVLDREWIDRLAGAIERIKAAPGPLHQRLRPEDAGEYFSEKFMWTFDPDFRALAFESPLAGIAGRILRARKVNLFHDQILVKEPYTTAPTPWHQDMNYFPIRGRQACSLWTPLDPVTGESGALEFVRGSHRWHDKPMQRDDLFASRDNAPAASAHADAVDDLAAEAQPDIDGERERYDILSWDMEPGDVVMFDVLMLHGGRGNTTARRRRAISLRLTGDGVTFVRKKVMMKLLRDPGLAPGDPLDCDLFPVLWHAPS